MKKTLLTAFLLSLGFANAQTFVSTTPQKKKIIIEEFTGIGCVYCPSGHAIANTITTNNPGNAFTINVHAGNFAVPGPGQPDFRTAFGTALANQSGLNGYPAGTVNRTVFGTFGQTAGATAMGRDKWTSTANTIKTQDSYVNVAVQATINSATNQLDVTVEIYYTGDSPATTNKLNLALLQNNTLGPQTGGNMGNNYNHQHRLVHMLTGQWGEDITTTTTGSFVSKTYSYTIPAAYKNVPTTLGDFELVAFVAETQQKIISGNGAVPTITGLAANDAAVDAIASITPTCGATISPKVTIQNKSQTALTTLPITYSINGGATNTFIWNGNLTPLQKAVVQLPATAFTTQAINSLLVSIPTDENATNNSKTINFNIAEETDKANITVRISLDRYGQENSWKIRNSSNAVVLQSPAYVEESSNGTYPQPDINISLPNGCYSFEIADAYGDGMCCSFGNGKYEILAGGVLIPGLTGGSYGSGETKFFKVNSTLSASDFDVTSIRFYPNPTNDKINISLPEMAKVTLTDLSGKTVMTSSLDAGESTLNLSSLSKGIYFINFAGENFTKTDKVILK